MLEPFIHDKTHHPTRAQSQTADFPSMHLSGEHACLWTACILQRSANLTAESVN